MEFTMAREVEIEHSEHEHPDAIPLVSSRKRGRPIAALVREFETHDSKATKGRGISSAAIRAGDIVRSLRKAAGLSQSQLATMLGVTQSRVSEIESGMGTQGPTWHIMERIAAACGKALFSMENFGPVDLSNTRLSPVTSDSMRTVFGKTVVQLAADPAASSVFAHKAFTVLTGGSATYDVTAEVHINEIEGHTFLSVEIPCQQRSAKTEVVNVIMRPIAVSGRIQELSALAPKLFPSSE
jgi:transcriptional regulator with XRE-family HTH domain